MGNNYKTYAIMLSFQGTTERAEKGCTSVLNGSTFSVVRRPEGPGRSL